MHKNKPKNRFTVDLLAGYLSQGYAILISIIAVPLQYKIIGPEGFGLVGLLTVIQIWFFLLDLGKTAFLTRESAQYLVSPNHAIHFYQLFYKVQKWIIAMAILGALGIFFFAEILAINWISAQLLNTQKITDCIRLIGGIVAFRMISEIYRGVLLGQGRIVWLSGFNSISITLRNFLALPFILAMGAHNSETIFFKFQLFISIVECIVLYGTSHHHLKRPLQIATELQPPLSSQQFAWQMWIAALIWVLVSQLDKILLTGFFSLETFGTFSLILILANGISLIVAPFNTIIPVRLTSLGGIDSKDGFLFYRTATRWVSISVSVIAAVLAFHPHEILFLWTGNSKLAQQGSILLRCYVLGNAIMAISSFPYYLQFSKGRLNLHLKGSVIYILLLIPTMIYFISTSGMNGAGIAWLIINTVYAILWTPIVHRQYSNHLHSIWLFFDVLPPLFGAIIGSIFFSALEPPEDKIYLAAWILGATIIAFIFSFFSSYVATKYGPHKYKYKA